MNGVFLYEAMGGIRPAYVDEAEKQSFARPAWKKLLPLAACLMLVVGLAAAALQGSGAAFPGSPASSVPGHSFSAELRQAAAQMAVLSDPLLAAGTGCVLMLLGFAVGRLVETGKIHRLRPGAGKFILVLGLQILLMLPCLLPVNLDWFGNTLLRLVIGLCLGFRFLIPLIGYLWVYLFDLQKSGGKKVSWGYFFGVAVFPILYVLLTGGQAEETVQSLLFSAYYVPCLMICLISTIVLKLQVKRKGEQHGRE